MKKLMYGIAAAIMATCLSSPPAVAQNYTQTTGEESGYDGGAVNDPYAPNPEITDDAPALKSTGGSKFSFIGFKSDHTILEVIYLAGYSAGYYGAGLECPIVSQWTFTIKRDGAFIDGLSVNAFGIIDLQNHCGLHWVIPARDTFAPGNYEFRMSQVNTGADLVQNRILNGCDPGAVTPMYRTRNDPYTDNLYTISPSDRDGSIVSYGYYDTGTAFKVSARTNPLSRPWKRFWKGAPQYEHYYTQSDSDSNLVTSWGWVYEKDEGNVYVTQLPGTVPLTRLSFYNGVNGDLQHVYVTSPGDVSSYQAQGWSSDGVVGYACQ